MAKKRLSMQERMRQRRSSRFVGREQQLELFRQNLDRSPSAENYYFIFNVYGQGGVGKTTLVKQYEQLAKEKGQVAAYTDESVAGVLDYMHRVAKALEEQGVKLKDFKKRYDVYLREKKQLEAHPDAPKGFMDLLGRSVAKAGVVAAREFIPGANLAMEYVDDKALVEQAGSWASHVRSFIGNKDEVELVLRPEAVLTPLWLDDLADALDEKKYCLVIDTFENTAPRLESWLLLLLKGEYGAAPENLQFIVAGRGALHATQWADFAPFTISIPLEPFSDIEARNFLQGKGIEDAATIDSICSLSGNLPVWLDMLGEEAARGAADLRDPSGDAVDRYLKWIDDPERRKLVLQAALPNYFDQDIIAALVADPAKAAALFEWLSNRPFVRRQDGKWHYHDVVRSHMLRLLWDRSQQEWRIVHRKLSEFHQRVQEQLYPQDSEEKWEDDQWFAHHVEYLYHRMGQDFAAFLPEMKRSLIRIGRLRWLDDVAKVADAIRSISLLNIQWGTLAKQITFFSSLYDDTESIEPDTRKKLISDLENVHDFFFAESELYLNKEDESFVYFVQGHYYNELGETDLAIEAYQKAVAVKPNDYEAWYNIGIVYSKKEEFDQSINAFRRAVEIDPENSEGWYKIGTTYWKKGELSESIEAFQKAAEAEPDSPEAWYNIGVLYSEKCEIDHAYRMYQKAIEIKPDYHFAWNNIGICYNEKGEPNRAIEAFQKAVKIKPDYHEAWYNLGTVYGVNGDLDRAIETFQKTMEVKPDKHEAWNNLGCVYEEKGDLDRAIEAYQKVVEAKPDFHEAWNNMGVAYEKKGDLNRAIEAYQRAMEAKPEDEDYQNNLGWAYLLQNEINNAEKHLLKAWRLSNKTHTHAPMNLAHIHLLRNERDQALPLYQKSLSLIEDPNEFFEGMEEDYTELNMAEKGIPRPQYDQLLQDLRDWYDQQPKD